MQTQRRLAAAERVPGSSAKDLSTAAAQRCAASAFQGSALEGEFLRRAPVEPVLKGALRRPTAIVETPPRRSLRVGARGLAVVQGLWALLSLWRRRNQERRVLATLDDKTLTDIGISRADRWREVNKPFWRP